MSDKRVLVISAIVLVAVIMGMSSVAPAIAPGPPADPPEGDLPEVDCDDLEDTIANASDRAKAKIRELSGCPTP